MTARLVRIAASLAVVVTAYAVYALTVVPIVEPWADVQVAEKHVAEQGKATVDPDERLRRQWGRYFAAEAWELHGAKVLESDQAVFFVGAYKNLPDGRVELRPFTMLSIPRDERNADGSTKPSGKAIAMEAPQGAILEFDEPFDMRKAKISKLKGADMMGAVHIHNAPPQPGSPDELDIVTRDVKLIDDRIVTPQKVDFRFGPNVGSGRDLKITLAKRDGDDANKSGANFSGVQLLELKHNVKTRVFMGGKGLMPGPAQGQAVAGKKDVVKQQEVAGPKTTAKQQAPGGPPAPAKAEPPVEVTCQGPFLFDVLKSVATFSDQVNVLRINPVGPGDTMNCETLAIYFAPKEEAKPQPGKPAPAADPTDKNSLSKLEARLIEARGDPVIVRSPSNGGNVRCQRLEYDIRNGTIRLEGEREVLLNQGTNEIRTQKLDYQPATVGRLGRLTAIGPGTLQGSMAEDPSRKYSARWSKQLLMQPEGELHRITLLGNAQMRLNDTGALNAEEIFIWISEPPPTAEPPPRAAPRPAAAAAGPASLSQTGVAGGVQVERLLAVDKVRIDSVQLTGATNRLEVWFDRPPVATGSVTSSPAPNPAATSSPAPTAASTTAPVAAPPAPPTPPAPKSQLARSPANPLQRFDVAGTLLRLQVAAPPGMPMAVSEVTVEGNARLVETKTAKFTDKPLLVRGQTLHMDHADTPNAHVTVTGKPAYVEARGMTLSGATIQMLKGDNRLWVDGAGRMTLPTKGQFAAAPRGAIAPAVAPPKADGGAPTPPLEITWQAGMNFDGLTAIYQRMVLAQTEHQWLRTEYLAVSLKRRIDFGAGPPAEGSGAPNNEVDHVDCRGGVLLEARDFDERGLTAIDQMQLNTLSVNQTSGAIDGQGPGWINRVSRGEPAAGASGPKAAADKPVATAGAVADKQAGAAPPKENRLTYLHVTFERGLTGNLNRREVTFTDQVRAVYGPVLTWQDKLDGDNMSSLGPDGIVMNCQQLTVREMPPLIRGERGTMELEALGNTLVEGRSFTAHAHRLTYAQAKDLLIFEGDGRNDAELYRQVAVGLPMTKAAARKIMYWRTANRAEVDDARHIDIGSIPGGPAGKPPTKSAAGFLTPLPKSMGP